MCESSISTLQPCIAEAPNLRSLPSLSSVDLSVTGLSSRAPWNGKGKEGKRGSGRRRAEQGGQHAQGGTKHRHPSPTMAATESDGRTDGLGLILISPKRGARPARFAPPSPPRPRDEPGRYDAMRGEMTRDETRRDEGRRSSPSLPPSPLFSWGRQVTSEHASERRRGRQ